MSNFRESKVISEPQPSERLSSETSSRHPLPVTMIFWITIMLLSLIISLFAALAVEWWIKTPENSSSSPISPLATVPPPQSQSPETSPPPPAQPAAPSAPITWKEIAQQLQQSEEMKTEVFTNTLKKLPELAPLPRPEAAPPVTMPKIEPTIPWKNLGSQLEHVEQQQDEMLRKLFEKSREVTN